MLTIGKLAARARLSTNALRFYEREGLLSPASKSESGYDEAAVARVGFIQHAQQCGFTLVEIQELLSLRSRESACCEDVRPLAVEKKMQLEAKIRSMRLMSKALDLLIADCPDRDRPLDDCPILRALEQVSPRPAA